MTTFQIRDDYIGTSAAARRLGLSRRYLLQLEGWGKIPCVRTAVGRLFDPQDIEKLAEERRERVRA